MAGIKTEAEFREDCIRAIVASYMGEHDRHWVEETMKEWPELFKKCYRKYLEYETGKDQYPYDTGDPYGYQVDYASNNFFMAY